MKQIVFLLVALTILSCSSSSNTPEFIDEVSGRYLFNPDDIIEVYFTENELFLKWNGATSIKPMKIDDTTFYVKEMNEKVQFLTNPDDGLTYLCLVPKDENSTITYNYKKLSSDEKLPKEYFDNEEYDKALESYLAIQKNDSLNEIISERRFNSWGYTYMRTKDYKTAVEVFKINVVLYPNSSNVFDSLGDAYLRDKDTIPAIENYKKSVALDSGNRSAKRHIEDLEGKK